MLPDVRPGERVRVQVKFPYKYATAPPLVVEGTFLHHDVPQDYWDVAWDGQDCVARICGEWITGLELI